MIQQGGIVARTLLNYFKGDNMKKVGLFKRIINGIGREFDESPLKLGGFFLLVCIGIYIFIGNVSFEASHGDTEIKLTTKEGK